MTTPVDDVLDALAEQSAPIGDGSDPANWDLAPVAEMMANKTVVGMGEASHGSHEFFQLKADLFRRLVEDHGVRLFGLEANYSETLAVDRYVRNAADAPDSAADALARTYFWPWYVAELRDLVEWLREFNAGRPAADQVRFFGFDAQYAVGGADALQQFLADADSDLLDEHRETLETLADWGLDTDDEDLLQERIADARAFIDAAQDRLDERRGEYVDATDEPAVERAELHLATMGDALAIETAEEQLAGMERRDRAMADGVSRLLNHSTHDRIALWAHNGHVQRAPYTMEGELLRRMGQHLAERHGDDYAALGFSFTTGSYQAMATNDDGEYGLRDCPVGDASEGSVGATLGRVDGSPVFFDIRTMAADDRFAEFLSKERPLRQPGGMYDPEKDYKTDIVLADAFDALIHVDETTRAVPLGHPSEIDSWG